MNSIPSEKHIFNPRYSTAIGIIQYAIDHRDDLYHSDNLNNGSFVKKIFKNIKELFNN